MMAAQTSTQDALQQRIAQIRAERERGATMDRSGGVLNGLPGWSYYVTFTELTPPRVLADLRASGWTPADAMHAGVTVAAATGHDPTKVQLWVKPAAIVEEDLREERAKRPRPVRLSARGMRATH